MNAHVKVWQNTLIGKKLLLPGSSDGVFGPKTLDASLTLAKVDPEEGEKKIIIDRVGDTQLLIDTCKEYGLLRNQCAYVLATAYWETARTMKPVQEAFWMSETWRRRNLRYYPWHGRGHVQLTWEDNYRRAEREHGIPYTQDPSLAMVSENSAKITVQGMLEGWFTGKKLADYVTLRKSDFVRARRIVNGNDKARSIAAIAREYDRDLRLEGYGE